MNTVTKEKKKDDWLFSSIILELRLVFVQANNDTIIVQPPELVY